jgi:UDP-N-acetylglucosamine 4,6-dehydratase/5-epimerase
VDRDSIVMITGGTGTFGNAMVERLAAADIKEIRILSRDEKKQHDMRLHYGDPRMKFYVGDVRDRDSLRDALVGVDYLFHAAALKQIPSCEFYPLQALMTNSLGTENVMSAARDCGVRRMVVLSTDKAAYPINAMGISKAMMERLAYAKARAAESTGLTICVTRYGNVMGSRGSVIPLFADQIKSGSAITITDPEMTRFMMTIEGAVDLVLYAFDHGSSGELFVQKAPAATITTLVEAMQRLYKSDVPVRTIGSRHGEKLYETLLTREEMLRATDQGAYYRVWPDTRDLNYERYFTEGDVHAAELEDYHSHNTRRLDIEGMCELLLQVEPVRSDVGHA